jgi:putative addiction module component (TIGR02574 family)
LDEGENQASDSRCDGCGTPQKKFYWRPVAHADSGVAIMLDYESVLADASRLPVPDRLQLIETLWETLPADFLPPLSEEWLAEVRQRSAQYDSGNAHGMPWAEIKTDALRRAGIQ